MIYRHTYWGLLSVGPDEHNLLTSAVKEKNYLGKIVTPFEYKTKEEAVGDAFEYYFQVVDDHPVILGIHHALDERIEEGWDIPEGCPLRDKISEENWARYRLIRLYDAPENMAGDLEGNVLKYGRPSEKAWRKIFPVIGIYHLKKVAYSVIAIPDVSDGGREKCKSL